MKREKHILLKADIIKDNNQSQQFSVYKFKQENKFKKKYLLKLSALALSYMFL